MIPPEDSLALESQYLFRDRHPDREAIYRRQDSLSAAARRCLHCLADRPYAAHPQARLDIFPAGRSDAPTLVFFHGGYWRSNSKESFAFLAPPLVAAGAHLVLVGYPLAPAVPLSAIADCAVTALRWCRRNAGLWQGDGENLFVAGHSAGGQLAALVAAEGQARACIALSGLFDLAPLRRTSLAPLLPGDEAELRALSPLHRPGRQPLDLYVGAEETEGFRRQTADFAAAARAAGAPVLCESLPGLHHYSIVLSLADRESALFGRVARRLGLRPTV